VKALRGVGYGGGARVDVKYGLRPSPVEVSFYGGVARKVA
jgi:hypothetical protein